MKSFEKLDIEKQKRILNAAFDEFAEQGYEKASTNNIVKKAGIGKGMLFYYFKTKKQLFYYLVEYGINYVEKYYLNLIDENEQDFIEKYRKIALVKLKAYKDNPHIFNFFGNFYLNKEFIFPEKLLIKLHKVRELAYSKLYKNIDKSLFREDIEYEKAFTLIRWMFDGYEKYLLNKLEDKNLINYDVAQLYDEYFEYFAILRKLFYK